VSDLGPHVFPPPRVDARDRSTVVSHQTIMPSHEHSLDMKLVRVPYSVWCAWIVTMAQRRAT